jgi:hypothetical protein
MSLKFKSNVTNGTALFLKTNKTTTTNKKVETGQLKSLYLSVQT